MGSIVHPVRPISVALSCVKDEVVYISQGIGRGLTREAIGNWRFTLSATEGSIQPTVPPTERGATPHPGDTPDPGAEIASIIMGEGDIKMMEPHGFKRGGPFAPSSLRHAIQSINPSTWLRSTTKRTFRLCMSSPPPRMRLRPRASALN